MANFPAIVTLARFLTRCFIVFFYGIELYGNHFILISFGRFLSILISFVAEGICTSFLEFSFVLSIVNPND